MFLLFIVLVIVVIIYYRGKAKYQEAHPRNCARCNKLIPTGIELDGAVMCEDCGKFSYLGAEHRVDRLRQHKDTKHITYSEVKQFLDSVPEREQSENNFSATAKSPSGIILVDEKQGLIKIDNCFAHKIRDIKRIRLIYDYESGGVGRNSTGEYTGGHIEIDYNDFYMTDDINKDVTNKFFDFATKIETKKVYADEIAFLEKYTGVKHTVSSF